MRKTRVAGLLVAVAAMATMLVIPAVGGAHHRVNTDIRISNDKPALHGVLGSKHESCERGRSVVVKKARNNRRNKIVGVDASSYNGGWSVDVNHRGVYIVSIDGFNGCGGDRKRVLVG